MSRLAAILVLALLFAGCAPSLHTAQVAGADKRLAGDAPEVSSERCERLSRTERTIRYVAVGSAALSGGAGLTTIATDDRDATQALAISAAGLAVVAVTAETVRAEVAADWARECQW